MSDIIALHNGDILTCHDQAACEGRHCSIHNPSEHPLSSAPLSWRSDRRLMERVCPCGVGHPDPDHLAFVEQQHGKRAAWVEGVHACCGCCAAKEAA